MAAKTGGIQAAKVLWDVISGERKDMARIITYMSQNPRTTVQETARDLSLPTSSVYAFVDVLKESNLIVESEKRGRESLYSVPEFNLRISIEFEGVKNTQDNEIILMPQSLQAYAYADKPALSFFIQRHGFDKFAKFAVRYVEYKEGKVPVFLIAKELEATEFEIAAMISDIEENAP